MSQAGAYFDNNSPGGFVQTLTGNTGGAVGPSAGNINVIGSGSITVTGNPGSHTLTISNTGYTVLEYTNVNTTPYVVVATDEYLSVDSSSLAITVELPNAPIIGRTYIIKDRVGNAVANNITITTVGGVVLIDGNATYALNTAYAAIQVLFNGSNYEIF